MPRMKPIEPWYSLYKQIDKASKRPGLTAEEFRRARVARNALYVLAYNREPDAGAVEALRDLLDKKRS